jgi:hypothetical protein
MLNALAVKFRGCNNIKAHVKCLAKVTIPV